MSGIIRCAMIDREYPDYTDGVWDDGEWTGWDWINLSCTDKNCGSFGIIAIDLTKVSNPQFGLLSAPSPSDARFMLECHVGDVVEAHSSLVNLARAPRVLGFLLRAVAIAHCVDTNTLMYSQQSGIAELPDLSARCREVFEAVRLSLGAQVPSWLVTPGFG
jgi:hypothetical protein